jgi:hypothetical protein
MWRDPIPTTRITDRTDPATSGGPTHWQLIRPHRWPLTVQLRKQSTIRWRRKQALPRSLIRFRRCDIPSISMRLLSFMISDSNTSFSATLTSMQCSTRTYGFCLRAILVATVVGAISDTPVRSRGSASVSNRHVQVPCHQKR